MAHELEIFEPGRTDAATDALADGVNVTAPPSRIALTLYGFTFFTSAFLLFQVQLVISKYILPWFGGTPAVFTTCMLFFQLLLLLGYAYAQALTFRLTPRKQVVLHISLLSLALILPTVRTFTWGSPLLPDASWKPVASGGPLLQIPALLFGSVALPYFALSTTGPLLQAWFSRRYNQLPYRWYALSNAGSLLGLLTYPLVVEPTLPLRVQAAVWFVAFAMFAVACACVANASNAGRLATEATQPPDCAETFAATASLQRRLTWLLLAACGSSMLLATTNQICQDIAVVPLLWVLPLSLYLLSFILCFDSDRWYSRPLWSLTLGLGTLLTVFALYHPRLPLALQIAIYCFALFAVCMVSHGELTRLKPATTHLTTFYLIVAAGGALGGLFVSIIAPLLFRGFWEFQLSLWVSCVALFVLLLSDPASWIYRPRPWLLAFSALVVFFGPWAKELERKPVTLAFAFAGILAFIAFILVGQRPSPGHVRQKPARFSAGFTAIVVGAILAVPAIAAVRGALVTSRNFYGVLTISEGVFDNPEIYARQLRHGKIIHGFQYLSSDVRHVPTGYYTPRSGVGLAIANHPARLAGQNLHIGVVGLGVGTVAAYGRPGDYLRFYEINPDVVRVAAGPDQLFTYVADSPAQIDVILGDARLSMERELTRQDPQRFDVLAVDAFSGDAVPLHLLTVEAFNLYLQQLRGPDSLLAFHISNRALDLSPVIARAAEHFGRTAWLVNTTGPPEELSTWVIVSQHRSLPSGERITLLQPNPRFRIWTDDYSNILAVLRR
jgi:hypothetical protein